MMADLQNPESYSHKRGDGEAAIIECLSAGQNFVFDPATNFLHADDGTVSGIRYIAEHGDLPQSPWPAFDWAIERIRNLEVALRDAEQALFWASRQHHQHGNVTAQKATELSAHAARAALAAPASEGGRDE